MPRILCPSAFVPPGFHVENAVQDGGITIITVRHTSKTSRCPNCAVIAERVHSRYGVIAESSQNPTLSSVEWLGPWVSEGPEGIL
jgi:hypothetical protein